MRAFHETANLRSCGILIQERRTRLNTRLRKSMHLNICDVTCARMPARERCEEAEYLGCVRAGMLAMTRHDGQPACIAVLSRGFDRCFCFLRLYARGVPLFYPAVTCCGT